jgi:hypothetical protein
MDNRIKRLEFADFLDRLAKEKVTRNDWNQFAVAHYADENLERLRQQLVQLAIGHDQPEAPSWSNLDRRQFQMWSDQLRDSG